MDDFGAGYSSLNMITTLPIDILKIDMSFVRNMEKSERDQKLVELVVDIARFLNVPTVAEGVETDSQLATLKKMGCEIIQGYYFSKPVPPADFIPFIKKELERRKTGK
jgi:EAL domain-containing protein (putative c-di-GMP-specific phosphodiesterase class I)